MKDDYILLKVLAAFVGTLVFGGMLISTLPFGYVESAVLVLAAVVAASAVWIGREKLPALAENNKMFNEQKKVEDHLS